VSKLKKALLWIAAIAGVGTLAWLFGFQTATALMFRYKCRHIPEAYETPVPLRDVSIAPTPHEQFSFANYKFELSEDDVDEAKSRQVGDNIRVIAFRSGNALWFSRFPARSFVGGLEKEMSVSTVDLRRLYGDEAVQSDYGFHTAMLQVTPSKLSPFESSEQSARDAMLLTIKVIAMPPADTGLFSIHVNGWRGFQFGDPQKDPRSIIDDLYDDDGGVEFIFFQKAGTNGAISQAQINRVLASLRKAPPSAGVR
jgi:hypothetical protein